MKTRPPKLRFNWHAFFVIAATLMFWVLLGMSLKGCTQ